MAGQPKIDGRSGLSGSERAYQQLLLLLKTAAHGARLPGELDMAQRFGVSRPVLRQALERLRAEGRISSRKGAGNFVGTPPDAVPFGPLTSIADVRAFLEFRCVLESEMAALAAVNHTRKQLAAIRSARRAMDKNAAKGQAGGEHDIAFHAAIAQASGNRFYEMTLGALAEQIRYSLGLILGLAAHQPALRISQAQAEHDAIERAIAARDRDAAASAMRAHLRGGIVRLFGN